MRETGNITPLLLEYGFIDNTADARKLQNNLLDYVEAVVKAVANYTGYPYISPGGVVENTYTVQRGDSLYSIAQRFGTTVDELRSLNNLTSNTLQIGQVLILPTQETEEEQYITYTVKSGDSLYKIAQQYDTTIKELIDLNNLTSTVLSIGQKLKIPSNIVIPEPEIPTPEIPDTGENNLYTVVSGDSLYGIARKYGITVNELIAANNLSGTTLQIGDVLIIPSSGTNTPEIDYLTYTVKAGDSLYSIAQRYNTTVDRIKTFNNLTNNSLQIGQQLRIPTSSTPVPTTYAVQRGDSLYSIAQKFGTTVDRLKSLNNLTSNTLQIGQILQIPTT